MYFSLAGACSSLADLLCSMGERVTRLATAALAMEFAPITATWADLKWLGKLSDITSV